MFTAVLAAPPGASVRPVTARWGPAPRESRLAIAADIAVEHRLADDERTDRPEATDACREVGDHEATAFELHTSPAPRPPADRRG